MIVLCCVFVISFVASLSLPSDCFRLGFYELTHHFLSDQVDKRALVEATGQCGERQ